MQKTKKRREEYSVDCTMGYSSITHTCGLPSLREWPTTYILNINVLYFIALEESI